MGISLDVERVLKVGVAYIEQSRLKKKKRRERGRGVYKGESR